ncbi:hypothetical protein IscW_ISCW014527 [Ixodes scapularis]|uniref:Receptor ligand binding region domain-containing protein n=1 Tax=Ixodes scapularis TaxID=6945 RepID=B7QMB0_IXOSC|nr:hypothetical protein IscW_ISCW014527 [Ixodes scapularis]|eukprot:XP_002416315.1 hypothetical protein IscW_ISCW014527 [Ixodes scapularis]
MPALMLAVLAWSAALGSSTARSTRTLVVLPYEDGCRSFNATTLRYTTETLLKGHDLLKTHLEEVNLTLHIRNATDDACQTGGLSSLIRAMQDPGVAGVVGGLNEDVCAAGEALARMHRKPLVVWNCHGWQSGSDEAPPGFARVAPNVALATFALASSLNDLRVKYAVLVVCNQQPWTALAKELEVRLRPSGVVVHRVIALSSDATLADVDTELRVIRAPVKGEPLAMRLRS